MPFQGATSALVFVKLLNHPPDPVRDWNESIPRELEKIIFKLMAKERTARFQTAQDLDDALARINEKGSGGGSWLRKAVATVPLVRAPEPIARERRASRKATQDANKEVGREANQPEARNGSAPATQPLRAGLAEGLGDRNVTPAPTGRMQSRSSMPAADTIPTHLRPVARVPRDESTPQPLNRADSSHDWRSLKQGSLSQFGRADPAVSHPSAPSERAVQQQGDFGQLGDSVERARDASSHTPVPESAFASEINEAAATGNRARGVQPYSLDALSVQTADEPVGFADRSVSSSRQGIAAGAYDTGLADPLASPLKAESDGIDEEGMVFSGPAVRERRPTIFQPNANAGVARPAIAGSRRARTSAVVIAAVAVAMIAFIFYKNRGHFGPVALTQDDRVILTRFDNQTGDKLLDGTVSQALYLALRQSPYLRLTSSDAFRSALRLAGVAPGDPLSPVQARILAEKTGARAYLYGSIKGTIAPYTVHVDLLNTSSNDVIATVEERAASLQQLPGAIDRVADGIRSSAGEDSSSINETHNALATEASANLDALHAFAGGEDALAADRPLDALALYQKAVEFDPAFVQAQLRLVSLYRRMHAEVSTADAARLALAASDHRSRRLRSIAQYQYEISASGDYARAGAIIRDLLKDRPNDAEVLSAQALVDRLLGRLADALQSGQQAYTEDPYCLEAYIQAEDALVALDRYDAALQLEDQAQRLGLRHGGGSLLPAYLAGRQQALERAVADYNAASPGQRSDWRYGVYQDNSGRLAEGIALWRANADAVQGVKGLESEASYLLAQGALDHALLGDCTDALSLADEAAPYPQGLHARFNSGMSRALCGQPAAARAVIETLKQTYPQSSEVREYLIADLEAGIALSANDPAAALEALRPTRQFDLLSLTPYLRGLSHVALRQVQIGIVDFQTVLSHRGVTMIVGASDYPAAEIGVARAFADTGDMGNSADAYRRFVELWKGADQQNPLLIEAKAKGR